MMYPLFPRIAALPAVVLALSSPSQADPKIVKVPPAVSPVEISATYKISLNGFDLGGMQFNTRVKNGTYTADSDVRLSALLGAFKWHGVTRTSGTISGTQHQPQGYSFQFDGSMRSGSIAMGFSGPEVTSLKVAPASFAAPDSVPLERHHMRNALDPLSAILALIRMEGTNPCAKKLQIFDGKQRFELALSYRRQEPLGTGADGAPVMGVVCKVKYTPIAGYRPAGETQALAQSNDIDIVFRPLAGKGLAIPHRVVVPTMAGDAVIEAERVNIDTAARGEVALAD